MSSLLLRRLIAWAIGMGTGFLLTWLFITLVLPWMGPHGGQPITIQTYGIQYFFWTALPLGLFFVIWLDYFLNTRIMPE